MTTARYCLTELPKLDCAVRGAERVLIAADFDGTLCPIAPSPHEVRMPPATMEIVRRMACCERVHLAVMSGRALADVAGRVPPGLTVVGNHGLEIRTGGTVIEHERARELRPRLVSGCSALAEAMAPWHGAWVEDKGVSATLHFREVDPRFHHTLLLTARHCLGQLGPEFALRAGKKALEIRPKQGWHKGDALRYIREQNGPFDLTVCLGDDRTDETMFLADERQINIKVGCERPTLAAYCLSDPGEVAIFLTHVLDVREAAVRTTAAQAVLS